MKVVRARLCDFVQNRSVATELRTIGVRQDLKLIDRVDSHRSIQAAGSRAVCKIVLHVSVVQQLGLSVRTGPGHRVRETATVKRSLEDPAEIADARRQQHQLLEISAV